MSSLEIACTVLPHGRGLELPRTATSGSSGVDLCAAVKAPVFIPVLGRAQVPTGLVIEIPAGYEAQIRPRSGLALDHGITVLNAPGTVDSDYRGEVFVLLANLGSREFEVARGMRIAQLVVAEVVRVALVDSHAPLSDTERGKGGFGHTGL